MPEKQILSAVEVLNLVLKRVERIEADSADVAAILVKMIEKQSATPKPSRWENDPCMVRVKPKTA